jgi:hypothetical protein
MVNNEDEYIGLCSGTDSVCGTITDDDTCNRTDGCEYQFIYRSEDFRTIFTDDSLVCTDCGTDRGSSTISSPKNDGCYCNIGLVSNDPSGLFVDKVDGSEGGCVQCIVDFGGAALEAVPIGVGTKNTTRSINKCKTCPTNWVKMTEFERDGTITERVDHLAEVTAQGLNVCTPQETTTTSLDEMPGYIMTNNNEDNSPTDIYNLDTCSIHLAKTIGDERIRGGDTLDETPPNNIITAVPIKSINIISEQDAIISKIGVNMYGIDDNNKDFEKFRLLSSNPDNTQMPSVNIKCSRAICSSNNADDKEKCHEKTMYYGNIVGCTQSSDETECGTQMVSISGDYRVGRPVTGQPPDTLVLNVEEHHDLDNIRYFTNNETSTRTCTIEYTPCIPSSDVNSDAPDQKIIGANWEGPFADVVGTHNSSETMCPLNYFSKTTDNECQRCPTGKLYNNNVSVGATDDDSVKCVSERYLEYVEQVEDGYNKESLITCPLRHVSDLNEGRNVIIEKENTFCEFGGGSGDLDCKLSQTGITISPDNYMRQAEIGLFCDEGCNKREPQVTPSPDPLNDNYNVVCDGDNDYCELKIQPSSSTIDTICTGITSLGKSCLLDYLENDTCGDGCKKIECLTSPSTAPEPYCTAKIRMDIFDTCIDCPDGTDATKINYTPSESSLPEIGCYTPETVASSMVPCNIQGGEIEGTIDGNVRKLGDEVNGGLIIKKNFIPIIGTNINSNYILLDDLITTGREEFREGDKFRFECTDNVGTTDPILLNYINQGLGVDVTPGLIIETDMVDDLTIIGGAQSCDIYLYERNKSNCFWCPQYADIGETHYHVTGGDTSEANCEIKCPSAVCPPGKTHVDPSMSPVCNNILTMDDPFCQNGDCCEPCPAGKASSGGTCEPCNGGTYSSSGASTCTTCDDGTTPNAEYTGCDSCPVGEAGTGGTCQPCTEETYSPGGVSTCMTCGEGTSSNSDNTECVDNLCSVNNQTLQQLENLIDVEHRHNFLTNIRRALATNHAGDFPITQDINGSLTVNNLKIVVEAANVYRMIENPSFGDVFADSTTEGLVLSRGCPSGYINTGTDTPISIECSTGGGAFTIGGCSPLAPDSNNKCPLNHGKCRALDPGDSQSTIELCDSYDSLEICEQESVCLWHPANQLLDPFFSNNATTGVVSGLTEACQGEFKPKYADTADATLRTCSGIADTAWDNMCGVLEETQCNTGLCEFDNVTQTCKPKDGVCNFNRVATCNCVMPGGIIQNNVINDGDTDNIEYLCKKNCASGESSVIYSPPTTPDDFYDHSRCCEEKKCKVNSDDLRYCSDVNGTVNDKRFYECLTDNQVYNIGGALKINQHIITLANSLDTNAAALASLEPEGGKNIQCSKNLVLVPQQTPMPSQQTVGDEEQITMAVNKEPVGWSVGDEVILEETIGVSTAQSTHYHTGGQYRSHSSVDTTGPDTIASQIYTITFTKPTTLTTVIDEGNFNNFRIISDCDIKLTTTSFQKYVAQTECNTGHLAERERSSDGTDWVNVFHHYDGEGSDFYISCQDETGLFKLPTNCLPESVAMCTDYDCDGGGLLNNSLHPSASNIPCDSDSSAPTTCLTNIANTDRCCYNANDECTANTDDRHETDHNGIKSLKTTEYTGELEKWEYGDPSTDRCITNPAGGYCVAAVDCSTFTIGESTCPTSVCAYTPTSAASCTESATTTVPSEATACSDVTELSDETACLAVQLGGVVGAGSACTYTEPVEESCTSVPIRDRNGDCNTHSQNKNSCEGVDECEWINTITPPTECNSVTTQDSCETNPGCVFIPEVSENKICGRDGPPRNSIKEKCVDQGTLTDCNGITNCEWNPISSANDPNGGYCKKVSGSGCCEERDGYCINNTDGIDEECSGETNQITNDTRWMANDPQCCSAIGEEKCSYIDSTDFDFDCGAYNMRSRQASENISLCSSDLGYNPTRCNNDVKKTNCCEFITDKCIGNTDSSQDIDCLNRGKINRPGLCIEERGNVDCTEENENCITSNGGYYIFHTDITNETDCISGGKVWTDYGEIIHHGDKSVAQCCKWSFGDYCHEFQENDGCGEGSSLSSINIYKDNKNLSDTYSDGELQPLCSTVTTMEECEVIAGCSFRSIDGDEVACRISGGLTRDLPEGEKVEKCCLNRNDYCKNNTDSVNDHTCGERKAFTDGAESILQGENPEVSCCRNITDQCFNNTNPEHDVSCGALNPQVAATYPLISHRGELQEKPNADSPTNITLRESAAQTGDRNVQLEALMENADYNDQRSGRLADWRTAYTHGGGGYYSDERVTCCEPINSICGPNPSSHSGALHGEAARVFNCETDILDENQEPMNYRNATVEHTCTDGGLATGSSPMPTSCRIALLHNTQDTIDGCCDRIENMCQGNTDQTQDVNCSEHIDGEGPMDNIVEGCYGTTQQRNNQVTSEQDCTGDHEWLTSSRITKGTQPREKCCKNILGKCAGNTDTTEDVICSNIQTNSTIKLDSTGAPIDRPSGIDGDCCEIKGKCRGNDDTSQNFQCPVNMIDKVVNGVPPDCNGNCTPDICCESIPEREGKCFRNDDPLGDYTCPTGMENKQGDPSCDGECNNSTCCDTFVGCSGNINQLNDVECPPKHTYKSNVSPVILENTDSATRIEACCEVVDFCSGNTETNSDWNDNRCSTLNIGGVNPFISVVGGSENIRIETALGSNVQEVQASVCCMPNPDVSNQRFNLTAPPSTERFTNIEAFTNVDNEKNELGNYTQNILCLLFLIIIIFYYNN